MAQLQHDATAAALEGAIPSASNFMDVVTEYDSIADAASALESHRGNLLERETALQRWAVALELEVTPSPYIFMYIICVDIY